MNNVQIFKNAEFGEIRTVVEHEQILFCASDVAKALGYARPNDAVNQFCPHTVKHRIGVETGQRADGSPAIQQLSMNFIPEGDVYRLIIRSKLPAAEKFERWVFDEVLPTIRKHGAYMTDDALHKAITEPDFLIRLATELKREKEARQQAEQQIEADRPKVLFAGAVSASHTSILIGDLAKLLKQNGYETGQKRLFQQLRDEGYLIKSGSSKNMPTQKAMEMGLFEVKETAFNNPDGTIRVTKTTKVTGKGQVYFINLYLGHRTEESC